jgi:hypothetical protein
MANRNSKLKTMRVFYAILFITLMSCSGDDDNSTCDCMGQWGDVDSVDYVMETSIDCDSQLPLSNPTGDPNAGFKGCQ